MAKRDEKEVKRLRLRDYMEKNELKSVDIADKTLYKPQTVRMWMCGQREVPPRALRMLKLEQ